MINILDEMNAVAVAGVLDTLTDNNCLIKARRSHLKAAY